MKKINMKNHATFTYEELMDIYLIHCEDKVAKYKMTESTVNDYQRTLKQFR